MQDPSRLTATQAAALIRDGSCARPSGWKPVSTDRVARGGRARLRLVQRRSRPPGRRRCPPGSAARAAAGVKDVLDTADMPSAYGSPIWHGWRPRADAAAVAWARAAGATVIGKTVTTEFATRKPGPTTNPHRLTHTPGGSSSGSAAGVADGFFPLAYGTQTAGSVIRPAAYCGVVGYKPSFGMISRFGMKVMAGSLDTVGVMARSVADCALLAGSCRGATSAIRSAGRRGRRVSASAAPRRGLPPAGNPGAATARDGSTDARRGRGAGPRAAGRFCRSDRGASDRHE